MSPQPKYSLFPAVGIEHATQPRALSRNASRGRETGRQPDVADPASVDANATPVSPRTLPASETAEMDLPQFTSQPIMHVATNLSPDSIPLFSLVRESTATSTTVTSSRLEDDDRSLYGLPSPISENTTLVGSRGSFSPVSTTGGRRKAPPSNITVAQPPRTQAMRSMFPTYDEELKLEEQYYLPSQMSPTHIPFTSVCKSPNSPDFRTEGHGVVGGKGGLLFEPVNGPYDCFTRTMDLADIWRNLKGDKQDISRRDFRLQMHRPATATASNSRWGKKKVAVKKNGPDRILSFGPSPEAPFFSVDQSRDDISVWKHTVSRFAQQPGRFEGTRVLVAECQLKASRENDPEAHHVPLGDASDLVMSFTPQASLLESLANEGVSALASSPRALNGTPAAAPQADNLMRSSTGEELKKRCACDIVFTSIHGARQRGYALQHPILGRMGIKIQGDVRLPDTNNEADSDFPCGSGSIDLHAPITENYYLDAATAPDCKNPPEIILASLDLASNTLFLDGIALADVQEPHIVDITLTTLICVLLAETHHPRLSQELSFSAPPTVAVTDMVQGKERRYVPAVLRSKKVKVKKVGRREKVALEFEQTLTSVFGALVVVLEFAVDGLATLVDKKQQGEGKTV